MEPVEWVTGMRLLGGFMWEWTAVGCVAAAVTYMVRRAESYSAPEKPEEATAASEVRASRETDLLDHIPHVRTAYKVVSEELARIRTFPLMEDVMSCSHCASTDVKITDRVLLEDWQWYDQDPWLTVRLIPISFIFELECKRCGTVLPPRIPLDFPPALHGYVSTEGYGISFSADIDEDTPAKKEVIEDGIT